MTTRGALGIGLLGHQLRLVSPIAGEPLVSILIVTQDRLSLLEACIESVRDGGRR